MVQTALGGHQSVNDTSCRGRVHDQRDLAYDIAQPDPRHHRRQAEGPFYIFRRSDVKRFNIHSDEQFALDLLHEQAHPHQPRRRSTGIAPTTSAWCTCPRIGSCAETTGEISDFFSYRQR